MLTHEDIPHTLPYLWAQSGLTLNSVRSTKCCL